MNNQVPKPDLGGKSQKTRKRDDKVKQEPGVFRDLIVEKLNSLAGNFEEISKYLDTACDDKFLNYRKYSSEFLDILLAGGIIEPGGSLALTSKKDLAFCKACVFAAESDEKAVIFKYYLVFYKLVRRYKYLESYFTEELKRLLQFLKTYTDDQRSKFATILALFFIHGSFPVKVLEPLLLSEILVREGIVLQFITRVFQIWLTEKDMNTVANSLRTCKLDKFMDYMPPNRRTLESLTAHFQEANLQVIVDYYLAQRLGEQRKRFQKYIEQLVNIDADETENNANAGELLRAKKEEAGFSDTEAIVIAWNGIMNCVAWSKKEELIADQVARHLNAQSPLLKVFASTPQAQLSLLFRIQEYCYDNMTFQKAFTKIVHLLYQCDVLEEDAILNWYKDTKHTKKGKTVFVAQMAKFIEWLQNAEEESEDEEDEEVGNGKTVNEAEVKELISEVENVQVH